MITNFGNPGITGASIIKIDTENARGWINWLCGSGLPPSYTYQVRFALAHSDSGVTWGYLDEYTEWKLGSSVDLTLCPVPTVASLHELRLFGNSAEILIWRSDDLLMGRILADDNIAHHVSGPLCPMNEGRRLRGECREIREGFKLYVDSGGAQHLAPESFPEDFSVRHYFEQDPETGAVRIAATRLVPERLL